MSDCRLRISTLPSLQCARLLLLKSEQSGELYPSEDGGMVSLTHSRKVYERLGPWPFAKGPILNERITHGACAPASLPRGFIVASVRFLLAHPTSRPLLRDRVPLFRFALPLHSPSALLRAPGANSSSRRRGAWPSQPVDSTLRVEVDCALSGSLSCACSRF